MSDPILATDFDRAVLVRWIRSGQSRPYADSVYEAELTFTGKNISTRPDTITIVCGCHPTEKDVKALAFVLVSPFQEIGTDPWTARLTVCKCVEKSPGLSRWLIQVVQPYTD